MNENIAIWDAPGPFGLGMRVRDANESRPRFSWMIRRVMCIVVRIDLVSGIENFMRLGRHGRRCR